MYLKEEIQAEALFATRPEASLVGAGKAESGSRDGGY